MNRFCSFVAAFLVLGCLVLAGCRDHASPSPAISVTNSYLECAVRDLLGDSTPVSRLAEPGMCPGHFDMRPSQVTELRQCRLLLRFDFQDSLDRQLGNLGALSIASITVPDGMCIPDSYLTVCRQTAEALVRAGLLGRSDADARLATIQSRLTQTSATAQSKVEQVGLPQRPIITSAHQAAFCRWLKLDLTAAIGGADSASVRQLDTAISAAKQIQCRLVIANRPEGTELAARIAEELNAQLVVFDNFPDLSPRQSSFDTMLLDNVNRLVAAAKP
jgi:zinc transport system substrate-binding protein